VAPIFGISGPRPRLVNDADLPNKSELRRQDWRIAESVVLADLELLDTLRDVADSAVAEATWMTVQSPMFDLP